MTVHKYQTTHGSCESKKYYVTVSVLDRGFMSDRAELNLLQATGGGILNIKSEMTTVYF